LSAAAAVLAEARAAGLALTAEAGGLRCRPKAPPELLGKLRDHAAELVELLVGPAWTDDRAWVGRVVRAAPPEAKLATLAAWVGAAGGTVAGGVAILPPLRPRHARRLAELEVRRLARRFGLEAVEDPARVLPPPVAPRPEPEPAAAPPDEAWLLKQAFARLSRRAAGRGVEEQALRSLFIQELAAGRELAGLPRLTPAPNVEAFTRAANVLVFGRPRLAVVEAETWHPWPRPDPEPELAEVAGDVPSASDCRRRSAPGETP
jgi:hypothetical protein